MWCSFELRRRVPSSRTQVLKSIQIGSLSPRPPGGEGWGEGVNFTTANTFPPNTQKRPHSLTAAGPSSVWPINWPASPSDPYLLHSKRRTGP